MTTAYLDCFSGVSGDMFIGALLDAGLPFEELENKIMSLPFDGYGLRSFKEERMGLFGTRFVVELKGQGHVHRHLKDVKEIIEAGALEEAVKKKCVDIFELIAEVEGKAHNLPPDKVHFHEVGAVDSIIDIIGAVYGLAYLGIDSLCTSTIPLGSGFVECAHGRIPVPAPATIELLRGIPVYDSGLPFELVTPTGAAFIKGLSVSQGPMPPMTVDRIGYGVGTRKLPDRPNLVRILIGQESAGNETETVLVLETDTDDSSPEWLGYLMERLFEAGALDVVFFPVQMKKNRPAVHVQVVSRPEKKEQLIKTFFRENSTLGVRFRYCQREILNRSEEEVVSPWGAVKVKKVISADGSAEIMPEYESCRDLALKNDVPLRRIFYWVMGLNR